MRSLLSLNFLNYSPFSKKLELLNLVISVGFLFLIIVMVSTNYQASFIEIKSYELFAELLFLNTIHVLFTLFFFFNVPEFKDLLTQKSADVGYSVAGLWICIFVCFFAMFWYLFGAISADDGVWVIPVIFLGTMVLRGIHSTQQSAGISLMYYAKLRDMNPDCEDLSSCIKLERVLGYLISSILIIFAFKTLFYNNAILNKFLLLVFLAELLLLGYLLVKLYKINKDFFKLRLLFLTRYIFYPIASPISSFAVRSCHGVEYLMIADKVNRKSSSLNKKSMVNAFNILLIIAFVFLFWMVFDNKGMRQSAGGLALPSELHGYFTRFCFSLFYAATHLHFLADAFIFRFKDARVQKNLGNLFFERLR